MPTEAAAPFDEDPHGALLGPANTGSSITEDATITQSGTSTDGLDFPPGWEQRFSDITTAGRGGMATVYRAFDNTLSRPVALKLMRGEVVHGESELEIRFRREAAAMARLSHPNIVAVYDTGISDHQMWIALEWIDGEPLSNLLKTRELPVQQALEILVQTARAVHHAHERGIVHRDLKPSNILVAKSGDAKVADFGIAHFLADESQLTRTDSAIGTPRYMAPEQADPQRGNITVRTDVYALGIILYELLSGRTPFVAESFAATVHAITHDDATPLRSIDRTIDVDLEAITLKAIEKDPAARYGSAAAFADDLAAFIAGDPVSARRQTTWYRLMKRARKHKLAVALGTMATVATVSSSAWGAMSWIHTVEQTRVAQRFGQRVERIEALAQRSELIPRHDLTVDHETIRAEMKAIRSEMTSVGESASGPGHYALGRGHLALAELDAANAELEQAWNDGYRTPETAYARGLALGRLYQVERSIALRISDAEARAEAITALQTSYRDPALELLRSAGDAALDAPEYVEALIAFYEGRDEEALQLARAASTRLPWYHDAIRLEGDVHFDRAEGAEDRDAAQQQLALARAAYERAAGVARSDFESYERLCALGGTYLLWASGFAEAESETQTYLTACDHALELVPESSQIQRSLARIHGALGESAVRSGKDPESHLRLAIAAGAKAVEYGASDPFTHRSKAFAHYTLSRILLIRGHDLLPDTQRAIEGFTKVLELDPTDRYSRHHLAHSYSLRAQHLAGLGREFLPDFDRAIAEIEKISPTGTYRLTRLVDLSNIHALRAVFELRAGLDPTRTLAAGHEAVEAALELAGKGMRHSPLLNKARMFATEAEFATLHARDAAEPIAKSFASFEAALEDAPSHYVNNDLGQVLLLGIANERRMGRSEKIDTWLEQASGYFQRVHDADPSLWVATAGFVKIDLFRAEDAAARGESPEPFVRQALARLDAADDVPPLLMLRPSLAEPMLRWSHARGEAVDSWAADGIAALEKLATDFPGAHVHEAAASFYRKLAELEPRPAWVEAGLEAAEETLRQNPRSSSALADKAVLLDIAAATGLRDADVLHEARRIFAEAVERAPIIAIEQAAARARLLDATTP